MCEVENSNIVPLGIDLSEFYMSVEWDILEVPAVRYVNHIIFIILFRLIPDCSEASIELNSKDQY